MKKIIFFILSSLLAASCEMYLPPKNTVTDEDLMGSAKGMSIYMARLYSKMPFEDFKYMAEWGIKFDGWLQAPGIDGCGEAINRDGTFQTFTQGKEFAPVTLAKQQHHGKDGGKPLPGLIHQKTALPVHTAHKAHVFQLAQRLPHRVAAKSQLRHQAALRGQLRSQGQLALQNLAFQVFQYQIIGADSGFFLTCRRFRFHPANPSSADS